MILILFQKSVFLFFLFLISFFNVNDNNNLKKELTKWKNRFLNIINFIKNRLLRPKDKDKYNEFTIDLYTHKALDQETFDDIRNNYSKEKKKR